MRRALVLLLLAAVVLTGCRGGDSDAKPGAVALPAPLPSVELASFTGGEPVDLATLRGPMVVNLWASWCGPCRQEMPVLEKFAAAYDGRVEVLGVDYQDPQVDEARTLVRQTGVTYRLLSDPDGELDRLGPFPHLRGLPFLAFVDAEGQVVAWEFAVIEDVAELEALVHKHLGV
ncbi:TlpA disulfide reductase family protein [Nocardioides sp. 616]|uniref:TlpA family protein disulfide reductase n=1 Tax=Nocardioides sp. 616 TaxID=2268090 RepID=UPI000CE5267A|nr:TlpA disulfide reductase family protein [Nocardioides sp. 616]